MNTNSALYQTDQIRGYDGRGQEIDCAETGQNGDIRAGLTWPMPRFEEGQAVVKDSISGLVWRRSAMGPKEFTDWPSALTAIRLMNAKMAYGYNDWRLPNIRELESLVALDQNSPPFP